MLSNRPYLIRAFYEWIVDSNCTPILVINAEHPRCHVPRDYVEGGEIVFNISSSAIRDLKINNEQVEFKASFSGVIHLISAPTKAILAVYAEEEESETDGIVQLKEIEKAPHHSFDNKTNYQERAQTRKPFLRLIE